MKRLTLQTVRVALLTLRCLAYSPASGSWSGRNEMTDGVVRPFSSLGMTVAFPSMTAAAQLLVVPRSIPMVIFSAPLSPAGDVFLPHGGGAACMGSVVPCGTFPPPRRRGMLYVRVFLRPAYAGKEGAT